MRSLLACLFKGGQRLGEVQLPEGAESVKEGVGNRMQIHLHLLPSGKGGSCSSSIVRPRMTPRKPIALTR